MSVRDDNEKKRRVFSCLRNRCLNQWDQNTAARLSVLVLFVLVLGIGNC